MRRIAVTGLVALAAVLGSLAAPTAAIATQAAPAKTATPASAAPVPVPASSAIAIERALAAHHSGTVGGTASPAATAPFNYLIGVACLAHGDCLAVGGNANGAGGQGTPLAYLWNGHYWRATAIHLPSGATGGFLYGVSCTLGVCIATGYYDKGGRDYPLAQYWHGNGWSLGTQPALALNGADDYLQSVSCVTSHLCLAVGYYIPSGNTVAQIALTETWNGSSWKAARPPTPSTPWAELDTVSCPATNFCLAGGSYLTTTGGPALAESWNGAGWSVAAMPQPNDPASGWFNFIDAVNCTPTTATNCAVVGDSGQYNPSTGALPITAFSQLRTGTAWRATSLHLPAGQQSQLNGISCQPTAGTVIYCIAVGGVGAYATTNTGGRAAYSQWTGSAWNSHVFTPPTGQGALWYGDTCLSPSYCIATGTEGAYNQASGHGLTGFWNGVTWALVST